MTQVISDFFYLTAITVVFFNLYAFVDKKTKHLVFVLNFIDGWAHIVTNKNYS